MNLKVEREGRRILGVNLAEVVTFGIKPLIGRGELGEGRVDAIFGNLWWAGGFGRRPGFYFPQAKMLEDLLDDLLVLYDAYDLHRAGAFRICKRIHLPGSSPGQAAIFCIRRY